MPKLSDGARAVCGQYFPFHDSKLVSMPPHQRLSEISEHLDELIAAGLCTMEGTERRGQIVITGSKEAANICGQHRASVLARSLRS